MRRFSSQGFGGQCVLLLGILVAAASLGGCPPDVGVGLVASPESLNFGETANQLTLSVSHTYSSSYVEPVVVQSSADWIIPETCLSADDRCLFSSLGQVSIPVRIDRSKTDLGTNRGTLVLDVRGASVLTVNVTVETLLKAGFTVSNSAPLAGEKVSFTDRSESSSSAGAIVSRQWDFGDGASSTEASPEHLYTSPGRYTVSLTVSTDSKTQSTSRDVYVTQNQAALSADFEADATTVVQNEDVHFVDKSVTPAAEPVLRWDWDFGDGTPLFSSTQKSVSHSYARTGVFTVTLTAHTASDAQSVSKADYIKVQAANGPQANFAAEDAAVFPVNPVHFYDLSAPGSSPITKWEWWFDYNAASPGAPDITDTRGPSNPSKRYETPGTHNVLLRVTTQDGVSEKLTAINVTYQSPVADFIVDDSVPKVNQAAHFTDESIPGAGQIVTWTWDFGDGQHSTSQDPQHTYTEVGTYTVSLTVTAQVTDPQGNPVNLTDSITKRSFILVTYTGENAVSEGEITFEGENGGDGSEGGNETEGEELPPPSGDVIYVGPAAEAGGYGYRTITQAMASVAAGVQLVLEKDIIYDAAYGETFPIQVKPGVTIRGEDGLAPDDLPSISGNSTTPTFSLSGGGSVLTRFENLEIENSSPAIQISSSRLLIRNCYIQYFIGTAISGGGVNSQVTIEDTVMRGSNWLTYGGYMEIGQDGDFIVRRCRFLRPVGFTGAVCSMAKQSTLLAEDCLFDRSEALMAQDFPGSGYGGVLWGKGAKSAVFKRCSFYSPYATYKGGAIYFIPAEAQSTGGSTGGGGGDDDERDKRLTEESNGEKVDVTVAANPVLELDDCVVQYASTRESEGGAIYLEGTDTAPVELKISNTVFAHCESTKTQKSAGHGGAIAAYKAIGTFVNSDFVGNAARNVNDVTYGGAIAIFAPGGDWVFKDCRFANNVCSYLGGALWFADMSKNVILQSCIFHDNIGSSGTGQNLPIYGYLSSQSVFLSANSTAVSDCYFLSADWRNLHVWTQVSAQSVFSNNVFVGNEHSTVVDFGSGVFSHNLWAYNALDQGYYAIYTTGTLTTDTHTDTTYHNSQFAFNRGGAVYQNDLAGAPVLKNCNIYFPGNTEPLYTQPLWAWGSDYMEPELYQVSDVNLLWGCENNISTDPRFPVLYSGSISTVDAPGTMDTPMTHTGTGEVLYGQSRITVQNATWTPDQFKGKLFFPDFDFFTNGTSAKQYYILSNTAKELYVLGDVVNSHYHAGYYEGYIPPSEGESGGGSDDDERDKRMQKQYLLPSTVTAGQAFTIWDIRPNPPSPMGGKGSDWPLHFVVPGPLAPYVTLTEDIDGNERPLGAGWDIGPSEFLEEGEARP